MKLKHILILQNKIDLVKESQAKEQYEQILAFVQGKSVDQKQQHNDRDILLKLSYFSFRHGC